MMTKEKWQQLESLCREAIEEAPHRARNHDVFQAIVLTGAFAASVVAHSEADHGA